MHVFLAAWCVALALLVGCGGDLDHGGRDQPGVTADRPLPAALAPAPRDVGTAEPETLPVRMAARPASCVATCAAQRAAGATCAPSVDVPTVACERACKRELEAATELGCAATASNLFACLSSPGAFACVASTDGPAPLPARCKAETDAYRACADGREAFPSSLCEDGGLTLRGRVDGRDVAIHEPAAGFDVLERAPGDSSGARAGGAGGTRVSVVASGLDALYSASQATALVRFPDGALACATAATASTRDGRDIRVHARELALLPACAAAPSVEGTLRGCFSDDGRGCGDLDAPGGFVTSTVVGAAFAETGSPVQLARGPRTGAGRHEITLRAALGFVDVDVSTAGDATAIVRMPEGTPDAGAVYCFTSGSLARSGSATSFALEGARRLGTCAEARVVPGALDACYRSEP